MQLFQFVIVPLLLLNLELAVLVLSLLICALCTSLVKLSLPILLALLKITQPLCFPLLLLLKASIFSGLSLFTLLLLALMLGDFVVKGFLSHTGGCLLL